MDAMIPRDQAVDMTAALLVLVLFLVLAVAGPVFGADSRRSRGWTDGEVNGEADAPLWSDGGARITR